MAPLAHAMRFVDHEHAHLSCEQALEEIAVLEPLRCQIEKLALPILDLAMRFPRLAAGEMGVHGDSVDALGIELVLLVLHQCDERADDNCKSGEGYCRQLVNERFAAACGHYDEGVASFQQRFDRLPLSAAEIIMAEALAQQCASFGLVYVFCHGA